MVSPIRIVRSNMIDSRTFIPQLSSVVQSGVRTVVYFGDADYICNYEGGLQAANNVTYAGTAKFNAAALSSYTVNGKASGLFKTQGKFSYLQVFKAGHEVPYYQPALALQVFTQTMKGNAISGT